MSKFCQLLQFRFQIDRKGRPWLFQVKSDNCKFAVKGNDFDKFKTYLLAETLNMIEVKVNNILKMEMIKAKDMNFL